MEVSGFEPLSSPQYITKLYSLLFTVSYLVFNIYQTTKLLGLFSSTATPPPYFDIIRKTVVDNTLCIVRHSPLYFKDIEILTTLDDKVVATPSHST